MTQNGSKDDTLEQAKKIAKYFSTRYPRRITEDTLAFERAF